MYNQFMKIMPTLKREKELWKQGKIVVGIDEAGRGAWAGPVVVAAVVLPPKHKQIDGITDSKLMTPAKRAELYETITDMALDFGVGVIDHKTIDDIGILNATKLGAKEAVAMMKTKANYMLTDALDLSEHITCEQEAIIKGDQKIYSISCASIIAKVTRDNLMTSLGGDYSRYQFGKHKGYGTKLHQEMLAKHGVSDIHRRSYKPIKVFCE
jgi:ribonuclease HII